MPDRRTECFARNVPCSTPRYPPVFAPRRAHPRGIAHHHGAAPGATGDDGASPARTADAAPHLSNIVPPRVTNVQSALHKKRRDRALDRCHEGGPARARRNRPWGEVPSAAAPAVRRDELSG
ncbi:hypothetical protein NL30_06440 [Burkholderia contaminans]|nr:hypothetical protein NL30_06440 [Burkholderia contaminans]